MDKPATLKEIEQILGITPERTALFKAIAKLDATRFKAYIAEGFTREEAFALLKEVIEKDSRK